MPILRSYQKPEEAYIDAGYLCSMGIDAVVIQDPAFSGILLGVIEAPYRLEVVESQLSEAAALLGARPEQNPMQVTPADAPEVSSQLTRLFRFILLYDTLCCMVFALGGQYFIVTPPQPVTDFLVSLSVSEGLWWFAYESYWPLLGLCIVSNTLSYFYLPLGRVLFALTTVWWLITLLGSPPMIFGPYVGFFTAVQNTLSSVALALMYWSPIKDKFSPRSLCGEAA